MMVQSSSLNPKVQVALCIQLYVGSGFSAIESTIALKLIGWAAEISCLVEGAAVKFYSYTLFSLTFQHIHSATATSGSMTWLPHPRELFGSSWFGRYVEKQIVDEFL